MTHSIMGNTLVILKNVAAIQISCQKNSGGDSISEANIDKIRSIVMDGKTIDGYNFYITINGTTHACVGEEAKTAINEYDNLVTALNLHLLDV